MVRTVSSVNLLSGTNNGKSIVLPQQNSWTDPIMSPAIAPSMPQSVARFPLQGNYPGPFKFDMKLEEPESSTLAKTGNEWATTEVFRTSRFGISSAINSNTRLRLRAQWLTCTLAVNPSFARLPDTARRNARHR